MAREACVVDTDHSHVLGDPEAKVLEGAYSSRCLHIAHREESRDAHFHGPDMPQNDPIGVILQKLRSPHKLPLTPETGLVQRPTITTKPIFGESKPLRPTEDSNSLVPMEDQMLRGQVAYGNVIAVYIRRFANRTSDENVRYVVTFQLT